MNFQVLIVTMNQTDLGLADRMNIQCDAIISNQADFESVLNKNVQFGKLKMITTPTKGVGLNRNIGIMASTADIILFGDDDMIYSEALESSVVAAFNQIPSADVIIFGLDIINNGSITERRRCKLRRLKLWNSMRYGTCRVAVRRKAIVDNNIVFNQRFGGGCDFSSGEDSLFIRDCFKNGLKVYSHPFVVGTCCKDKSSWFTGYNDKYFYDKGVLIRKLFPLTAYFIGVYFAIRFSKKAKLSVFKIIALLFAGIHNGKKMITYENWK